MSPLDRLKAFVWTCMTPVFPHLRNGLVRIRVLRHEFRQEFPIGRLAEGRTVESLREHLVQTHGFDKHVIAWIDQDEVLGMRKRVSFHWQYHLRVFRDGEVRGHYEWTPESRPLRHILEIGMEPRREVFLAFLGEWIVTGEETHSVNA